MTVLYSIGRLTALLVLVALMGCSSFAPFASSLSNPAKVSPDADSIPCYAALDGSDRLHRARNCVSDSIAEFSSIYRSAGVFDRSVSYLLWGAGTYAGIEAARTDPSESALKNVAVGVASILGFRAVTGTDAQRQILDRGTEALQCLLTTSYAVEQVPQADLTGFSQNAATRINNVIAPFNVDATRQQQLRSRTLSIIQPTLEATRDLNAAIGQAKSDLPLDLIDALMDVRREVQKQLLAPSPDLEKIAEMQQQRIADILKPIIEKQNALDAAKSVSRQQITSMAEVARELDNQAHRFSNDTALAASLTSKAMEYSQTATVATLVTLAGEDDGDAVQPAIKAFASCVSKAAVPKS